mmetsp:Transcript_48367/g.72136  ORF Transcript_48367/g.72136 Transcript_48367/m.72136 type:complete len:203 (+) Transcript_48367:196-804(+)
MHLAKESQKLSRHARGCVPSLEHFVATSVSDSSSHHFSSRSPRQEKSVAAADDHHDQDSFDDVEYRQANPCQLMYDQPLDHVIHYERYGSLLTACRRSVHRFDPCSSCESTELGVSRSCSDVVTASRSQWVSSPSCLAAQQPSDEPRATDSMHSLKCPRHTPRAEEVAPRHPDAAIRQDRLSRECPEHQHLHGKQQRCVREA